VTGEPARLAPPGSSSPRAQFPREEFHIRFVGPEPGLMAQEAVNFIGDDKLLVWCAPQKRKARTMRRRCCARN
jgi:hypothetical protein